MKIKSYIRLACVLISFFALSVPIIFAAPAKAPVSRERKESNHDKSRLPSRVKFYGSEREIEKGLTYFTGIYLGGASEIYYVQTTDPIWSISVISELENPFDYLDIDIVNEQLILSPSSLAYKDSSIDAYGKVVASPSDFIKIVVTSPKLDSIVSKDFDADFVCESLFSDKLDMALNDNSTIYLKSVECEIMNIASAGSNSLIIDYLFANTTNIALVGNGLIWIPLIYSDTVNAVGPNGGEMILGGSVKVANFSVTGNKIIDAAQLKSRITNFSMSDGGTLLCNATQGLYGNTGEKGVVFYSGKPTDIQVVGNDVFPTEDK